MVEVGGRPLLWHIMKGYAHHGFSDFILCLGHRGQMIKRYFFDYQLLDSDVTFDLESGLVEYTGPRGDAWRVTCADTGDRSMTGARVKRIEPYLGDGELAVYHHEGYWQCADTLRDVELLRGLWDAGQAPWRTWDSRIDPHGPNLGRRVTDAGLSPEAALRAAAEERAA